MRDKTNLSVFSFVVTLSIFASSAEAAPTYSRVLNQLKKDASQGSKSVEKGAKSWIKETKDNIARTAFSVVKDQRRISQEVNEQYRALASSDHISLATAKQQLWAAKEMGAVQTAMLRIPGEVARTAGTVSRGVVAGYILSTSGAVLVESSERAGKIRETLAMDNFHAINRQRYESQRLASVQRDLRQQEQARSTLSRSAASGSNAAPNNNLPFGRSSNSAYINPSSRGPGGISLSRAAAEKLNLNIDFDGAFFSDGRIVLSGKPQAKGIDAAIFLTSLRLACEPGDPYFSLDADDGKAWTEEGRQLSNIVLDKLRPRLEPSKSQRMKLRGLSMRVVSARQELGTEWPKMLSNYPNFKTRLVFKPVWLNQTRFGEILYKADVLLKELTAGVPTIRQEPKLRAAAIERYVPSDMRSNARSLLQNVESGTNAVSQNNWRGARLWFDLIAQPGNDNTNRGIDSVIPSPRTADGIALFQLLKRNHYISDERAGFTRTSIIAENGNAIDLSQVYPQMFVRVHDTATGSDLPGNDPDMDLLASDVNRRTEHYVAAYQELRDLSDVFRAYIVASKYIKSYPRACGDIKATPILSTEKPATPMPEHHTSELFLTLGQFGTSKEWNSVTSRSINGGISLPGKLFSQQQTQTSQPTPVTLELRREVETNTQENAWQAVSGRQFVSLKLRREDLIEPTPDRKLPPNAAVEIPQVSETMGRFELYSGARITGTKLNSGPLQNKYSQNPKASLEECMKVCSADSNCVAFEIDQSQDVCNSYSTVSRSTRDPKWAHGIWK